MAQWKSVCWVINGTDILHQMVRFINHPGNLRKYWRKQKKRSKQKRQALVVDVVPTKKSVVAYIRVREIVVSSLPFIVWPTGSPRKKEERNDSNNISLSLSCPPYTVIRIYIIFYLFFVFFCFFHIDPCKRVVPPGRDTGIQDKRNAQKGLVV